jgi:hypothetical protein
MKETAINWRIINAFGWGKMEGMEWELRDNRANNPLTSPWK